MNLNEEKREFAIIVIGVLLQENQELECGIEQRVQP